MTLSRALFPSMTWANQLLLVLVGSFFIALSAQIAVPYYPVPATFQTLAVLIVGLTFGARLGALTLLAYLGEGLIGLPVFANFNNGAAFAGPTAGFLVGFVGMAWLVGFAAERGWTRGVLRTAAVCIAASALLYIPGAIWPMALASAFGIDGGWVGIGLDKLWAWFMAPFLLADAIKAVLAALVVTGGWRALARRRKG